MSLKITKPIVSAEWLQSNLGNKNLIILDCTIAKITSKSNGTLFNYKKQIKGAIFFDIKNVFSDVKAPFPNTILPPKDFEEKARNLGVNNDSILICYDDLGIYSSPRVWWMFQLMGFKNIAVLDGGFPKWKENNLSIENQQTNQLKRGNFQVNYQSKKINFTNDVLSVIAKNTNLIADARSKGRFYGTEPEPRKDVKSGHIPNSVSLPYSEILENGSFKPKEDLQQIFKSINLSNKDFIFSCGTGITASILALGAELLGIKKYSVYDGSWTEWGSTEGLPIENNTSNLIWNKKEFLAYILLYAAHCNFLETKEEVAYILSKVDKTTYCKIHTEVVVDSDEDNLNKIQQYISENKIGQEEKNELLKDIKNVFFADGSVDVIEKKVFGLLKKILM